MQLDPDCLRDILLLIEKNHLLKVCFLIVIL